MELSALPDFLDYGITSVSAPRVNHDSSTSSKKSANLRDLSIELLQALQSKPAPRDFAGQLEHLAPQLERHVVFQKKVKKWQFAEEFDAIGRIRLRAQMMHGLIKEGTEVYNYSTRLIRTELHIDEIAVICHCTNAGSAHTEPDCAVRVVAILLLECGRKDVCDETATIRLFKTSIKTAKACQESGILPLAQKTLERSATFHEDLIRDCTTGLPRQKSEIMRSLEVDYYLSRISLARAQKNDQLAEYFLSKVSDSSLLEQLDGSKIIIISEALFSYGACQLKHEDACKAISWLQKCYRLILQRDEEIFHDIRIQTLQNLVRAYLLRADTQDMDSAATLIEFAAEDYPVAPWLYLLKADYTSKRFPADVQAFSSTLASMIRIVQITDSVFNNIIRRIHDLHKLDLQSACQVLDLLLPRTTELDKSDWVEKALVTRVWLTSQMPEHQHDAALEALLESFVTLEKRMKSNLGRRATHAAQILLWKVSDGLYNQNKYESALKWCSVARASIFHECESANEGKLVRRMTLCHLELGEISAARACLMDIPEIDMKLALTRFLLFRVNLQSASIDETLDNVRLLTECKDYQKSFLYHCAVQATNAGKIELSQALLSLILEEIQKESSDGDSLKLPALIRCIIRISKSELEKNVLANTQQLQLICSHLETAAKMVESDELFLKNGFNNFELEWFSKNTHNLAISGLSRWPNIYILRLLSCTFKFLNAYSLGDEHKLREDLAIRKLSCHYLTLCIRMFVARDESSKDVKVDFHMCNGLELTPQMEQMSLVCTETRLFRDVFQTIYRRDAQQHATVPEEHISKLAVALVFEFEAQIHLSAWTKVPGLVEVADAYQLSMTTFNNMADLILSCSAPVEAVYKVIDAITTASLTSRQHDILRISRWLRMMFTLCLTREDAVFDAFCSKLLEIIRDHAKTYPSDELQWLVARSFNRAVDHYSAGVHERCHRLSELALNIGNYAQDDALKLLVQKNYQQMINSM